MGVLITDTHKAIENKHQTAAYSLGSEVVISEMNGPIK